MAQPRLSAFVLVAAAGLGSAALAKLPPLSDEAKAKAAEAAAKAAWSDKVAAFQLCKSQDRVAAVYYADVKKEGKEAKPPVATPPCAEPGPFVYTPAPPPTAAAASAPASTAGKS